MCEAKYCTVSIMWKSRAAKSNWGKAASQGSGGTDVLGLAQGTSVMVVMLGP